MCPVFPFHTRAVVDQEINPKSGRVFAAWRGLEIVSIHVQIKNNIYGIVSFSISVPPLERE